MTDNIYVTTVNCVPRGETRSFGQIAALAGKPLAARAAGRALTSYPAEGKAAWQRAVTARGGFSIDPIRADWQLQKLRGDGARPRENESIERWAKRVGAKCIGNWRSGQCFATNDPRLAKLDPQFVERFADGQAAQERGFVPAQALETNPHETSREVGSARTGRARSGQAANPDTRARHPTKSTRTAARSDAAGPVRERAPTRRTPVKSPQRATRAS